MYIDLDDILKALQAEFISHEEAKKLYRAALEYQTNPDLRSKDCDVAYNSRVSVPAPSIFRA
jgi:predicted RNA-binding protein associated with RNAse of E/G family